MNLGLDLWGRQAGLRRLLLGALLLATGLALALLPVSWAAALLAGAVFAGLVLVWPTLALYAICFAIPFGSLLEVSVGPLTVGVTEGLVVLLLASWAARVVAYRQSLRWPRLSGALGVFIGAMLLSLLQAVALPLALKEIAKWIEFLAIMAFASNALTPTQGRRVVCCLLLAGLAQAFVGAYQFFAQSGPEFFVLMGRFMRAYGTFEQPNPYAGYLGLIAPLALALGISPLADRAAQSRTAWLRWLGVGSFGAVAAGIAMSWSRGGWLAFGAALTAVLLTRSRRGATALVALAIIAALAGILGAFELLPESVTARLTSFLPFVGVRDVRAIEITGENYASLERLAFWQAALDMWRDHLWVGVGIGNYAAAYPRYALPKWSMALGHAHNYYLNVAAEAGLSGLFAYVLVWGTGLIQVVASVRRAGDSYTRALALGALGVLVHVSVHNIVDNLWVHNMYLQVAIVLGLVEATTHHRSALS